MIIYFNPKTGITVKTKRQDFWLGPDWVAIDEVPDPDVAEFYDENFMNNNNAIEEVEEVALPTDFMGDLIPSLNTVATEVKITPLAYKTYNDVAKSARVLNDTVTVENVEYVYNGSHWKRSK